MTPRYLTVDRLAVEIHASRQALGRAAAQAAAAWLRGVIAERGGARVIFACAPSQDEFLAALAEVSLGGGPLSFDWGRLTVFHMDEYVGLAADDSRNFRHYLREHLLARVPKTKFHGIAGENPDAVRTAAAYSELIGEAPIDLICLGVGENGHIAFNDPPVADFEDPKPMKSVELDEACRRQQVNDGCFPSFAAVPTTALTLTIPVFRRARRLSVHVPGQRKAEAVKAALRDPIRTACPASILRLHPNATLYLEPDSASLLPPC